MTKKQVGILLRVSTKMQAQQADGDADIPTQREACLRFISQHPDWKLVKEYREVGVSGYKNAFSSRDKLMEVRNDISAGTIDVLVVFMFDRLGRIEAETPFVVKSFVEMGAEVWSVTEGQRRFDAHVDNLLNYLYFWQASGESEKTSQRVSNAMTQMARAGLYTGGRPPYGYCAVETGRLTKKRLPERTLAVHEEEAAVVRLVFELAFVRSWGCHRIAEELNRRGITTRTGVQWGHSAIANMLNNPLYKGVKAYGRTTGKGLGKRQKRLPQEQWITAAPNPSWVIVPPLQWDTVQQRRKHFARHSEQEAGRPVKSRLKFAGLARCGHCGTGMQTGYTTSRWTTQDGVHHRQSLPVYRCGARATGKTICDGPRHHSAASVEIPVVQWAAHYIAALPPTAFSREIERACGQRDAQRRKNLQALHREVSVLERELAALEEEVVKAVSGQSDFDRALLVRLLEEKKRVLQQSRQLLAESEAVPPFSATLPENINWVQVFVDAASEHQKAILCSLARQVMLRSDAVEVSLALSFKDFLQPVGDKVHPHDETVN